MKRAQTLPHVHLGSLRVKIVAAALFLACPVPGHAAPVLIDFNDAGPAASFGGTWNTIPDPFGTTLLVDASGALTNISLSFSDDWFDDVQISPWSHGDTAWIDGNAAMDGLNHNFQAPPGTINITGLATDLLYRIDLLAAQEFFAPIPESTADFSIFGSFGDSVPNGDNFDVHNDGLLGGKFMTWNAVTPNASGEILIQVAGLDLPPGDPGTQMLGDMASAARITCLRRTALGLQEVSCASVPEPGTIALLALVLAGVFVRLRRVGALGDPSR
jgi:hypothetical protein